MTARVRFLRLLVSVVLLSATVSSAFGGQSAYAAVQITNRKLTLVAGATDGGSLAGGIVNHLFDFTLPSNVSVGSIKFEYCKIAAGICDMPDNMTTIGSTLGSELGLTGFTIHSTVDGTIWLGRSASVGTGAAKYQFNGIKNPSAVNTSFFVRISTYASIDTTGTAIDAGVVTASTATQIVLTGIMPESLVFCTGATIPTFPVTGFPNCAGATAGDVNFNQLFSPSDTATATSQFSASTNALYGYSISVYGPTLTNGSYTIPAMAGGLGSRGVSGFGMNLVLNSTATSTVAVGADVAVGSNDSLGLRGKAATGYDTMDNFKFVAGSAGNLIAKSDFTGTNSPTNGQIYTASYIVNVSGSQVSGTYVSTLTFVATSTF